MSLFITGTGTNVGKTVVTAGLAALLRAQGQPFCVFKPVQTGSVDPAHPEDPQHIKDWLGDDAIATHCSYSFSEPVAPYLADTARTIHPRQILEDFQRLKREHRTVLVEGAGGVRVPIARNFDGLELIRMLQLPVLVVASPWLGTINHTLLTVDALVRERLEVRGVVISGMPETSPDPAVTGLMATLEEWLPVPLLGSLPVFDLQPGFLQQASHQQAFQRLGILEA